MVELADSLIGASITVSALIMPELACALVLVISAVVDEFAQGRFAYARVHYKNRLVLKNTGHCNEVFYIGKL